jgi:hypothetical protein
MIEILPPLGKYKYDTWWILSVKCYIDNFVRLWSCIWNVNKHFWHRYRGGSQYLLSIYRLHVIILTSIISLTDLSAALCLFMVFTRSCMTGFDLPANYHSDLESLIRKSHSRLSSPGSSGSHMNPHRWLPEVASMISQLHPVPMSGLVRRRTMEMAVSNINQFSSTWRSKAHSMARPQKMLMLIINTSWRSTSHSLSEEWLRMQYVFASFHFHC